MVQYIVALFDALKAREDEGQGLVEYALIITLVALVAAVALATLGTTVNGQFEAIVGKL